MASNFSELGVSGLKDTTTGIIRMEFLRELTGAEGAKRFREMADNSPIIGALLTATKQAVRSCSWQFTAGDEDDDPRVEFLTANMDGLTTSWNDHISEALSMLVYGWSLFEIVYQRGEDGRIMWRKFATRGQDTLDRWEFDDAGGMVAFWQRAAPKYISTRIPIEKCILYRTQVERNNPEGRSILRNAWTSYYYLKGIQQIEAIGIERDLAGLPVVTLPAAATTEDTDTSDYGKARKLVRNIRNDEQAGVVLPSPDWKLELLSTGGSRQFDTNTIIGRYESRILMSCLAQFLMLGQDRVGTQALSKDQTDFFNMAINTMADIIAEVHTKFSIPRLLALNGMDADGVKLIHTPVGDTDIAALGQVLAQTGAMLTWTPADEVWLRSVLKLPEKTEEEIEDAREEKREQQLELFAQRGNAFGNQPGKPGEKPDDERPDRQQRMSAEPVEAVTIGRLIELLEAK